VISSIEHITGTTGSLLMDLMVTIAFLHEVKTKGRLLRFYIPFFLFFALEYLYGYLLAFQSSPFSQYSITIAVCLGKLISIFFCFGGNKYQNVFRFIMYSLSPFISSLVIQIIFAMIKCELSILMAPSKELIYFWMIMTIFRLIIGFAFIYVLWRLSNLLPSDRLMRIIGLIMAMVIFLLTLKYAPLLEFFRHELMYNRSDLFTHLITTLSVAVLVICVTIAKFIYYQEKAGQAVRYNEFLQMEIKRQHDSFREMERSHQQLHKLRHDISSHILCLQNMAETGSMEQKEFANALKSKFDEASRGAICTNTVLNSILLKTKESCEEKNIEASFQISVPHELLISDIDLICVFSNLTSNAVQACERVSDGRRFIRLAVVLKSGVLTAFMENSSPKDGESYLYSTAKIDKQNHGWGNKIIREITEKYDGSFELKIAHNRAVTKLMMMDKAI